MTQEFYLKVYSGENSPMSTQEHTFKGSRSRPLYLNKQSLLKSSSHWIWIQDLPTGGLSYSSFHNWSFLLNTLQVDTRRGLRGETGVTLFREHKMCKEKLSTFSVRAWEKLTPTVYCAQERSWHCPSELDVSGQFFQKRQPIGACDSEKKPRHPPSTCLGEETLMGNGIVDHSLSWVTRDRPAVQSHPPTSFTSVRIGGGSFMESLCPEEPNRLHGSHRWKPTWCLPSYMKNVSASVSLSRTIT